MNTATTKAPSSKRRRRFARESQTKSSAANGASAARPASAVTEDKSQSNPRTKASMLIEMLKREEGATLEQMAAATGWLPHTTRAALSGLKKKGHEVTSTKAEGVRIYRVSEPLGATSDRPAINSDTAA